MCAQVGATYLWAVSGSSAIVKSIISSLLTPAAHIISLLVPLSSVTPVGVVAGLVGPVPPATLCAANPVQGGQENHITCVLFGCVCGMNKTVEVWYSHLCLKSLQISKCADKKAMLTHFLMLNFAPERKRHPPFIGSHICQLPARGLQVKTLLFNMHIDSEPLP